MGLEQPKNGSIEAVFNGSRMSGRSSEIGQHSSLVEALARRVITPPETLPKRDSVLDEDANVSDTADEEDQ